MALSSFIRMAIKRYYWLLDAREDVFRVILKGGDHILSFWYKMKHFRK